MASQHLVMHLLSFELVALALIVVTRAVYQYLHEHAPATSQVAVVVGLIRAGLLLASVIVTDITRFPNRDHLASWNGTAPIDASSGDQVRHRLSRAGNRQINRVLHIMATVQLRNPTDGRAYYDRRKADGKTSMESMRALKRRLSNIVYKTMVDDAITHAVTGTRTGPGGQRGNGSDSSATRLTTPHRLFGQATSRTRHHRS